MSNTETRLWGNTGPGPSIRCNVCGIDRMGVAAEIERLRARVAELEADRDRWKAEAMAARHGNRGQPIETYEAWKSALAANERGE